MNFCSIEYLFFLPLIVLLFFITKSKFRWIVLFIGSCAFYMSFIPEYILYLFFLIIVDYFMAFQTFQSIGYVIDVYRRKQVPEKNIFLYGNFVLFFPQMVAGPIERYSTLGANLKEDIRFDFSAIKKGLQLILIGFFYKMVIADN